MDGRQKRKGDKAGGRWHEGSSTVVLAATKVHGGGDGGGGGGGDGGGGWSVVMVMIMVALWQAAIAKGGKKGRRMGDQTSR